MASLSGGSGGGGGTLAGWCWAPGGGVNSGSVWEQLSDLHAAALAAQPDGQINLWIDATANADIADTADCDGLDFQRFSVIGAPGHAFVRPEIQVPTGVSFAVFGEIVAATLRGTGGYTYIPDGGKCLANVDQIVSNAGAPAVVQQITGLGALFAEGVDFGDDAAPTPAVKVHSGAMLVGSLMGGYVKANAFDDDGGAGNFALGFSGTEILGTQPDWSPGPLSLQPAPVTANSPQGRPIPWGDILGMVPSSPSAASFSMSAGWARDQANEVNIVAASPVSVNLANFGTNGRDYASALQNVLHAVYAIWGPGLPVAYVGSQSFTGPTLAGGYTHYVFVGDVGVTGGAVSIVPYHGDGREVMRLSAISLGSITAGSGTTTTFSLSPYINYASGRYTWIFAKVINALATGFVGLRPTAGGGNYITSVGSTVSQGMGFVPLAQEATIGHSSAAGTSGTATLYAYNTTRGAK